MIIYMISPVGLISLKKTIAVQSIFPQNQDSVSCLEEFVNRLIDKVVAVVAYEEVIKQLVAENKHCFGLAFFWITGHATPGMYLPQELYKRITTITNDHMENYRPTKAISDELAKKYAVKEFLTKAACMIGNNMANKLNEAFLNHQQFLIMYWCRNKHGMFDKGHTYGVAKMLDNHNETYYLIYDPSVTKLYIIKSVEEISEYFKAEYSTAIEQKDCFKLAFYSPLPSSGDQQVHQNRSIHVDPRPDESSNESPKKKSRTHSNRNAPSPG